MKNIVLIGYRCTGKTSVSKELAKIIGGESVSIDSEIEKRAGIKLDYFVKTHGWDKFREIEKEAVSDVSNKKGIIIDTGGGVILDPDNVKNLKRNSTVFLLTASPETIIKRIKLSYKRPALKEGKTLEQETKEILEERKARYTRAADHTITTDNLSVIQVAAAINKILKSQ